MNKKQEFLKKNRKSCFLKKKTLVFFQKKHDLKKTVFFPSLIAFTIYCKPFLYFCYTKMFIL